MNALITFATFLLTLGLTARLSHFVVDDTLTLPVRNYLARQAVHNVIWNASTHQHDGRTAKVRVFEFLSALTDCVNCTSVWVATAVTTAAVQTTDLTLSWFYFAAWVASLSYLTGIAADWRYAKQGEGV